MSVGVRPWSDMLPEILEMIKCRYVLSVGHHDHVFSSVCKQWRKIPQVFPADRNGASLLFYETPEDGVCNYYVPGLNKTFSVDCPLDLSGTIFRHTSHGWVLLSRGTHQFLLLNPLTGACHFLPVLDGPFAFHSVAFSGPPPLPPNPLPADFFILGLSNMVNAVHFRTLRREGDWSDEAYADNDSSFWLSDSNPVFLRGLFYCLSIDGRLGTFDPCTKQWTVLAKPTPIRPTAEAGDGDQCFLMESQGELVSVFVQRFTKKVRVFKLDQAEMKWEKADRLDDERALFVGYPVSTGSMVRGSMSNKVFFPRVHGELEMIPARVKEVGGRIVFVALVDYCKKRDVVERERKEEGVCYCPLGSKERCKYYKSKGYLFSIWYDV